MGRRARRREAGGDAGAPAFVAPTATFTDPDGNTLELRGSLTLKARQEYAGVLHGGNDREDAWQRAAELLFERLAVAWTIDGVTAASQRELLGRYRAATPGERRFVRDCLRAHAAEWFPELDAP
ncbi:hypothetical protein [Conexibacter sp. DBS9H8]|uniref:hypothetical protein n=1 Tax=Conexibacter sp. DBS9H8 TaxID=2937801 RepID=UPI00200D0E3A|nr:hypothetical protein [Conexibacter sp. DBS9H8]